ncbi:hypothetical protein EYF80_006274 [Liparis tanakae]|uniref:Uncharacterized protein n=1 Tax=Liparis tanakae TaxID=230148 RepID=A0A4Z2J1I3_9TELE|nr:hypothetical protein EYF80_006274 [Liparis tanakae]
MGVRQEEDEEDEEEEEQDVVDSGAPNQPPRGNARRDEAGTKAALCSLGAANRRRRLDLWDESGRFGEPTEES